MNILMVAGYYPPATVVGAKRPAFLARSWSARGDRIRVLTMQHGNRVGRDESLPVPGSVHRSRLWLPGPPRGDGIWQRLYGVLLGRYLGVPDEFVGWLLPGLRQGGRLLRAERPDVIVASGPPFTPLVVAALLARRFEVPLVLDYRDPWTGYPWRAGKRMLRRGRLARWIELRVVRRAAAAVFATPAMRDAFQKELGGSGYPRLAVITNGFDAALEPPRLRLDPEGVTSILYAGNFYGERSLRPVLTALAELASRGELARDRVRVHVLGAVSARDRAWLGDNGLADWVTEHPPVPHEQVLGYMRGADILYLPSGSDVSYALPFKLFDYLHARRPILAVAPAQSALASFMGDLDAGEFARADQPQAVRRALRRLLAGSGRYTFGRVEGYGWAALSDSYRALLQQVTEGAAPATARGRRRTAGRIGDGRAAEARRAP